MTETIGEAALIHAAVAARAVRDPEAAAIVRPDREISYGMLDAAANDYAADLADRGVGPGQVVPILMDRSPEMVALQLGVLKTGAAYANLDPGWPVERRKLILGLVASTVIISGEEPGDDWAGHYRPPDGGIEAAARRARSFDPPPVSPDAPATVFFTSGTTGVPKGVLSPHRAVTRLFGPHRLDGFGPGHVTPQVAALPWDMYAFETWGQLTTGGTVLVPAGYLLPETLRRMVSTYGVDTLWITTSVFNLFVDEALDCFAGLSNVYCGGEKASPEHMRAFLDRHPGLPLWNAYGPAESCMITTLRRLVPADCEVPGGVPVGTPVPGTSVVLLDKHDQRCEPGQEGEICIAGRGLATGYLGQPELTREKFPDVDLDGRLIRTYRTGDMGVWDDAGVLHYRGRRDRQIKISGMRIELAEIESVAGALPGVRNCLAFPVTGAAGLPQRLALVYLMPGSDADRPDDPLGVHARLRALLPAYMVPQIVRGLARYPVTANGKVDREALHEIARSSRPATRARPRRRDEGERSHPRNPWLPFGAGEDASVRLLCLPHAGAGAAVYRKWGRGLPGWIAACPVQPPGRETRRSEPPLTSAAEIARRLAPEVIRTVRPPYAILGHSTGALCAFEVVREIRRLDGTLPVHLFVAGRRPPSMPMIRTELAGLSPDELVTVLRRLGGTPEEILAEPFMLELMRPLLVADFHVNEKYHYRAEPRLPIPITAFAGTHDHFADPDQVAGWRQETDAGYGQVVLHGGHFAIFDRSAAVLGRIATDLAAAIAKV